MSGHSARYFNFIVYHYTVTVKTSNEFGAGTDANVWIRIYGSGHRTNQTELDSPDFDDFERHFYLVNTRSVERDIIYGHRSLVPSSVSFLCR